MNRRKKYRLMLCVMLFLGLWGLEALSVQLLQEEIPDCMQVEQLEELNLNPGFLVTGKVTPEAERVSSNAFSVREYQVECRLLGIFPVKTVNVQLTSPPEVYTGGIPVGIYLETNGVLIIGTGTVEGTDGLRYEPARSLVQPGDYILAVDQEEIHGKEELVEKIGSADEDVILTLRRNQTVLDVRLETVKTSDGTSKAGIWVRDNTQGIGTLTFITKDGNFGALGHGIMDVDTGSLLEMEEGTLYETQILNIRRGEQGSPGELSGMITYGSGSRYGSILQNEQVGIFGKASEKLIRAADQQLAEIAFKQDVKKGTAYIRSSVSGELEDYEVEITEVHCGEKDVNKGIVFRVTDERLLAMTGGVVQGMSGSPIMQDGKLVGAVTHVFVNDPTKGYGIFIENMLEH